MKKIFIYLLLGLFLSGCASYKFNLGQPSYEKGYVVNRDYKIIPEYTIGKDNSVPADLALAKARFKRRRKTVEYYYKKMELIENYFARSFWTPFVLMGKTIVGVFRLPFIAISDYKYEHNPKYRETIRKQDDARWALEDARRAEIKKKLNLYIQQDLQHEEK